MRKKIAILTALLVSFLCVGQTETENYISITDFQVAVDDGQEGNIDSSQKIENITYYDGLGRAKQSILVNAGGSGQNIINYMEYDALGRSLKQYLPYATPGEVVDPLDYVNQQALKLNIENFYNTNKYGDTQNPYSQMVYEDSPLNRTLEKASQGNSWAIENDHTIKLDYQNNIANEVSYYKIIFSGGDTTSPSLALSGYYAANVLYKSIVRDENWTSTSGNNHTIQEFTNKRGQVILKRSFNENIPHDTYYVYDDFGNLTYVLSPEASRQLVNGGNQQEILNNLGYQYKYDYRNRLIEKKVPGKGEEYIVYNSLDQPVLRQDARLRENDQWLFTKYDAFGRIAFTGKHTNNSSLSQIRLAVQNQSDIHVVQTDISINLDGENIYYDNLNVFPISNIEILTVNYYDEYVDTDGYTFPSSIYNQSVTLATQGLPTVSKVRILRTDDWITSITAYDEKARPILYYSKNSYLNTQDTSKLLLDFTGKTLESLTNHFKGDKSDPLSINITTYNYFTYDHQNRLLSHKQKINNEPLQLIASNTYDELGKLISKDVGGETTFDGYTNMVKVRVDMDGNIEKVPDDNSDNSFNASLKTKGEIKYNGGIKFTTAHNAFRNYRVGLVNANTSNEDPRYFDYGIHINAGDDNNDGFSDVYLVLSSITASNSNIYIGQYVDGDIFKVERNNGNILFKKNNTTVHTVVVDPNMTFVGKASLASYNTKINDFTLFGDFIDKKLQKIDYEYNIRGWLTSINPFDTFGKENDLFQFRINYDGDIEGSAGDVGQAIPLYNGNISQTIWKTANTDSQNRGYGYTYDDLNRFKAAYSRKGNTLSLNDNFQVFGIAYDRNGNILSLERNGTNEYGLASRMDDLIYSYDGNQLLAVEEGSMTTIKDEGFFDGNTSTSLDDYEYDVNGNIIIDRNKGITNISYNHLNLPTSIVIDGTDGQGDLNEGSISYVYDATGIKQAKIVQDNTQTNTITTFYAGGYIYEDDGSLEKLKMFPHPEGYVEPVYNTTKSIGKYDKSTQTSSFSHYQYVFNYKDHLGNVRLTYADSNGDGAIQTATEIISEKHYYPFGLKQKGYNNVVTSNSNSMAENFNYLGQEEQNDLGLNWVSYKWRNADQALGRFFGVDPITENFYYMSPYQFASNSPIWMIELEGLEGVNVVPDGTDLNELCDQEKVFPNVNLIEAGPIFSGSASLRGKYLGGGFGFSLGPNIKGRFEGAVVEGKVSTTTDGEGVVDSGQFNILSGSVKIAAPGMGQGQIGGSLVELGYEVDSENINPNKDNPSQIGEGYATMGTIYGKGETSNGISYSEGGSFFSTSEDKNLSLNGGNLKGGKVFTGALQGNSAGIGLNVGPGSASVGIDLDNLSISLGNFFSFLGAIFAQDDADDFRNFTPPSDEEIKY